MSFVLYVLLGCQAGPSHAASRAAADACNCECESEPVHATVLPVEVPPELRPRRDELLWRVANSTNNRSARKAERELQLDFRHDPVVQEAMHWAPGARRIPDPNR